MTDRRIIVPLFIQRQALAVFMGVWALDKFVNPQHTARVFSGFYGIELDLGLAWLVGLPQLIVILAFAAGFLKTVSYLLMFLMHAVSTVSSYKVYFAFLGEGGNLLFWAGIPVLAAFWVQYAFRSWDRMALDDLLQDRRARRHA